MKKFFIMLVAVVALSASAMAQAGSEKFAIGARVGYGYAGFPAEVSFMWGVGPELNRIEMDLGFSWWGAPGGAHYAGLQFTAAYQWRWNIVKGLHWYVGPGATVGSWFADLPFCFGVGGQVGIEYDFDAPIQLTLDYRPMVNFHPWDKAWGWGHYHDSFCFGVRYRF
jgi:hypothetical protein